MEVTKFLRHANQILARSTGAFAGLKNFQYRPD
jgi:hypothetical protein